MTKEIHGMWKMNKLIGLLLFAAVPAVADTMPQDSVESHMGVATCAASQCHGSAVPRDGSAVLQNEYVTWTQDDPHSGAFDTLSTDKSKAIANRLGLKSATTAKVCLDCHADNVPLARRGERFQLSDGVGCEACHGGAENWLATHYNTPAVAHADNLQAGMYSTGDSSSRAALCLSCHLGTDSKFATHRIMAAGHPRLTFELDTFTELWRTAGRQPHYVVDGDYAARKTGSSHIETWATGLLADGRRRLELIQNDSFAGTGLFPELGLYDCHACHRSMKSVQWRELSRHANTGPGTPFISDGTFVMALALTQTILPAAVDEISASLAQLHKASSESIDEIHIAASRLDAVLATVQKSIGQQSLQRSQEKLLAELLRQGAAGEFLDYASAEQAFMAVQMLAFEIDDDALLDEIDGLANSLDNDERFRPANFAKLLGALGNSENE
jgi:hypothetical protein